MMRPIPCYLYGSENRAAQDRRLVRDEPPHVARGRPFLFTPKPRG
jgi:hypothetical protein